MLMKIKSRLKKNAICMQNNTGTQNVCQKTNLIFQEKEQHHKDSWWWSFNYFSAVHWFWFRYEHKTVSPKHQRLWRRCVCLGLIVCQQPWLFASVWNTKLQTYDASYIWQQLFHWCVIIKLNLKKCDIKIKNTNLKGSFHLCKQHQWNP